MWNWKGDSKSGSFKPIMNADGSFSNLASALWSYPAADSIVKDIMFRTDARIILRNKLLWGYENLFLAEKDESSDGKGFSSALFSVSQICTPWLNRISSKSHDWFEEKLQRNVENGLKLLRVLAEEMGLRKSQFLELWLRALYVDNVSVDKVRQLGGSPRAFA